MKTNIVIPSWLAKVDNPFYSKLVTLVSEFNKLNTIPSNATTAWDTQFNLIISGLNTWKTTDRRLKTIEFVNVTIGFSSFATQNKIDTQYKNLIESAKFSNIFSFQGLTKESKTWNNNYFLSLTNVAYVASKINSSITYENTQMDSIKNQMITIIQDKSLQNLAISDVGKPIYTNLGFSGFANLNTGSLVIPTF